MHDAPCLAAGQFGEQRRAGRCPLRATRGVAGSKLLDFASIGGDEAQRRLAVGGQTGPGKLNKLEALVCRLDGESVNGPFPLYRLHAVKQRPDLDPPIAVLARAGRVLGPVFSPQSTQVSRMVLNARAVLRHSPEVNQVCSPGITHQS